MQPNNNKTKFIAYAAILFGIILIIVGVVMTVVLWQRTETDIQLTKDAKNGVTVSDYSKEYTDMLKIYNKLDKDWYILDDLPGIVKKIASSAEVDTDQDETGLGEGTIYTESGDEYITFDILREEDDADLTAENFVYHDEIDDAEYTIHKSGPETYQHHNGTITSEFKTKAEAIADHILYMK